MRLPDAFLDELRARTPLAPLIGRRAKLVRAGRQWKACCPFHAEKSPSFYIYDDGYHCFGCGAHGDAISFVMQTQGGTFMDAVQTLAGEAGLEVPKPSVAIAQAEQRRLDLLEVLEAAASHYQRALVSPSGAAALAYLRHRGLSDATIARFGLGWAGEGRGALAQALAGQATPARLLEVGLLRPREDGSPGNELFFNRVIFPIRDRRGRVISFGGRTLGDGQPKYLNGPETAVFSKRRTLYGIDFARAAARQHSVIVVEGYMDAIALHQAGFSAAVAPLGTALTEDQLELLWQFTPAPVLCFDGDAAGARAAARAADVALPRLAPDRTIRIATLPAGEDPDTLIRTHGAARMQAVVENARPLSEALFDLLREAAGTTTPEQRAAFRARLEGACARIADRGLGQEYKRDLLDRYFAAFRRGAPAKPSRRADRPAMSEAATVMERMRTLTAILLRHPALAHKLEDALSHLDLPPQGRRLADAVLAYADEAENLDFAALLAHLTHFDLAGEIAWALGDVPCPSPAYAGASADSVQAEAGWWHIYALLRGSQLEAEVAEAGARFHASQNAADLERLGALLAAREQWRRGEGSEQVIE